MSIGERNITGVALVVLALWVSPGCRDFRSRALPANGAGGAGAGGTTTDAGGSDRPVNTSGTGGARDSGTTPDAGGSDRPVNTDGAGADGTSCGTAGAACCAGDVCTGQAVCVTKVCAACGATGQLCCAGQSCAGGVVCSVAGTCGMCGGSG